MTEECIIPDNKRLCYTCGSDKTYTHPAGYENWYHDKEGNLICKKCYNKYISNPITSVKWNPIIHARYGPRRMRFKDKRIPLQSDPRIGVCSYCRAVREIDCKQTAMHHDENRYDPTNPLRYTLELCVSCHGKETTRLRSSLSMKK